MAVVYAIKNGNWSDGSTWNTGIVPTAEDDVYLNGYTISQDIQTITCKKISSKSIAGIGGGGMINRITSYNMTYINADIEGNGSLMINQTRNYLGWTINGNITQEGNSVALITGGVCVYYSFIINGNCKGYILGDTTLYGHWPGFNYSITINGNYEGRINIKSYYSSIEDSYCPVVINGDFHPYGICELTQNDHVYISGNVYCGYDSKCTLGFLHLSNNAIFKTFPKAYDISTDSDFIIDSEYIKMSNVTTFGLPSEDDVKVNVEYGIQNEYRGRYTPTILTDEQLQRIANCATMQEVAELSVAIANKDNE